MNLTRLPLSVLSIAILVSTSASAGLTINFGDVYNNNTGYNNFNDTVNNLGTFNNLSYFDNDQGSQFYNSGTVVNNDRFTNNSFVTNDGVFDNYGDFYNEGTFINSTNGVFTSFDYGNFLVNSTKITNNGLFNSNGFLINNDYAEIENTGVFSGNADFYQYGVFYNSGTLNIENIGFGQNGSLQNFGVINNSNQLSMGDFSILENNHTLNNDGVIEGGFNSQFINYGVVNNDQIISRFSEYENHSVINNRGDIDISSSPSPFENVSFINASGATINNESSSYFDRGTITVGHDAVLTNNGVIDNSADSLISIDREGQIVNTGVLYNREQARIEIDSSYFPSSIANIVNSGELSNYGYIGGSALIENSGELKNHGEIDSTNIVIEDGGVLSGDGQIQTGGVYGATSFTQGLLIEKGASISPNGRAFDYFGNLVEVDETARMNIDGDVLIEGTFDVDVGIAIHSMPELNDYLEFDQLVIDGNLFLGDESIIDIAFYEPFIVFGDMDLIVASAIHGGFSNNNFFHEGQWYAWEIIDGDYEDILRLGVTTVPLPAGAWLFLSGGLFLLGVARKKAVH